MAGKQKHTGLELGEKIARGEINPVELALETLEYMETCEFLDEIFARTCRERAMAEAQEARNRQRERRMKSPLDGVPISWKDLFDTAGIATESGSRLLLGRRPAQDCVALANATNAGLVCIGKTHLSELAFSGLGINPKTATSPNTHSPSLAPGGSSSGAAASVAYKLVPIGIGSDTGGSVRIPAAWNDLVGFKTTHGFISNEGVVPLCSSFDTAGPLCNTVADAWIITAIMAGERPELPEPKPIEHCRFAVNETITLDNLGTEQRAGFEAAVKALEAAGAKIEYKKFPLFEQIVNLGPVLFPYEAWQEWGTLIDANPGLMFKPVENRFRSGESITKDDFDDAWKKMLELRHAYNNDTSEYDAVLAPTVAIGPPDVKPLLADHELFSQTNMMALRNTRFFNMFGCCALTLPTMYPASGIMLAATGGRDRKLAAIGLSAEATLA